MALEAGGGGYVGCGLLRRRRVCTTFLGRPLVAASRRRILALEARGGTASADGRLAITLEMFLSATQTGQERRAGAFCSARHRRLRHFDARKVSAVYR